LKSDDLAIVITKIKRMSSKNQDKKNMLLNANMM